MTGTAPLTDHNAAALARLETRVDGIAGEVDKLAGTVDRFVEKTDERFERSETKGSEAMLRVDEKLTALVISANAANAAASTASVAGSRSDGGSAESMKERYASYFITIAIAAIGGFLTYVHGNIEGSITDNKNATHEIALLVTAQSKTMLDVSNSMAKAITEQGASLGKTITDQGTNLTAAIAASDEKARKELKEATKDLVPRPELDNRINSNKTEIENKVDKQVFAKAADMRDDQIEALRAENLRVRSEAARKEDLAPLWDAVRQTRDQVNDFQRKFVTVPAFPKYNDK